MNQRDHRKLLIVDGQTVFLGGINISGVYSGGSSRPALQDPSKGEQPWRDTDLQIDGPVVAEFQKLFLETWQAQKGEPLAARELLPAAAAQGQGGGACDRQLARRDFSQIYVTLLSAISSARPRSGSPTPISCPIRSCWPRSKAAAARGVDVRLVLPGRPIRRWYSTPAAPTTISCCGTA